MYPYPEPEGIQERLVGRNGDATEEVKKQKKTFWEEGTSGTHMRKKEGMAIGRNGGTFTLMQLRWNNEVKRGKLGPDYERCESQVQVFGFILEVWGRHERALKRKVGLFLDGGLLTLWYLPE